MCLHVEEEQGDVNMQKELDGKVNLNLRSPTIAETSETFSFLTTYVYS